MGDSVAYLLLRTLRQLPHVIEFEVSNLIDPSRCTYILNLVATVGQHFSYHRLEIKCNQRHELWAVQMHLVHLTPRSLDSTAA